MKRSAYRLAAWILAACMIFLFTSCDQPADPEVILRESLAKSEKIANCEATYRYSLTFHSEEKETRVSTSVDSTYFSSPFRLKEERTTNGTTSTTYLEAEDQDIWYYAKMEDGWKKVNVENQDRSPTKLLASLNLLKSAEQPKLVREEEWDGTPAYKLELSFPADTLHNTIAEIVAASGMGNGSQTLVSALLESVPPLFGYCYIAKESGLPLALELDATDALNTVFSNIDGDSVQITVSESIISGTIRNPDSADPFDLPPEAAAAEIMEAAG